MTPDRYVSAESCVDDILDRLGTDLTVGTPLGIGKPNHLLNELVDRALLDPDISLEIWTALSLTIPDPDSDLERRLVEPIAERLFGGYPDLVYNQRRMRGDLPANIEVHEFYLQPGAYVGNPLAQQHYHSENYTHALERFLSAEPNLVMQLVAPGRGQGDDHYNLGANTDVTPDLIERLIEQREAGGGDMMVVGQVNRNMPQMDGEATIDADRFDAVLDDEAYDYPLFGPPKELVSPADHAIGLRVSTLIRDGGTLQIGIGSLSDAIASALTLRQDDNDTYRELISALGAMDDAGDLVTEYGGLDFFDEGLYASTEMLVEGFMHLYENGVLSRTVYDDVGMQRLANSMESAADLDVTDLDVTDLDVLAEEGAISRRLDEADIEYLQSWGILQEDVTYEDGSLRVDDEQVPADLTAAETREAIADAGLGEEVTGGHVLDAAFFIGSADFYESLREMAPDRLEQFRMRSVQFTNDLYGPERLKRLQRQDARFVNAGMKATVTGAIVSDGTADGQVVSGVGGQFNFVNQAHELVDGRSILMIRATRGQGRGTESNIVWNYGHVTIPRHLRDIVVTEYGVADLRGKSDVAVIKEMIKIADSRFQDDLIDRAVDAGKLPADWSIPPQYQENYPDRLESVLDPYLGDVLQQFPLGTRLTDEEVGLARALRGLQATVKHRDFRSLGFADLRAGVAVPDAAEPYLKRMDLDRPGSARERAMRRVVALALVRSGEI